MPSVIKLKISGTASEIPDFSDLALGEFAWNYHDGKLFGKMDDGTEAIVDLTLSTPEDIIASGPGLVGRSAAGQGASALLTVAQARVLLGGYQGAGTTTQRDALSSPQAGWQWYNTDLSRYETYSGSFWLGPQDIVLDNRTGADSVYGESCIVSPTYDFSVASPGSASNPRVIGTIKTGGVANGSPIVVSINGVVVDVLMQANDSTTRGYFLFSYSTGENESLANPSEGAFGISLESKNDSENAYTIKGIVGLTAEVY